MRRLLALTAALGLAACSGGSPTHGDAGPDSDVVTCQNDARVDTYAPNMSKTSSLGGFRVVLVEANPAPPAIDNNTWTIRALDAMGQPYSTALTAVARMPDHGHGTTPINFTPNPDGTFTLMPIYLYMGGVWRIEFTPQGAGTNDPLDFFFCISG
jgi:hypothetical protein